MDEKIVDSVTKAFPGSPVCLAAVLLAATFGLLTYFALREDQTESHQRTMLVLEKCFANGHGEDIGRPH